MKRVALLVAHGTISNLDDLPEFLKEIRRGRPAPPELLAELRQRYEAVGGSPHFAETEAQARALSERLGMETRTAMRLWHPRVAEVVSDLGPEDEVILVPLAPFSVDVYEQAARAELAAQKVPPIIRCIEPFGQMPALIGAHVDTIEATLSFLSEGRSDNELSDNTLSSSDHSSKAPFELGSCRVILTAHSLPTAVIRAGDGYEHQFRETTRLVSERISCETATAYQSQGASGGEWLGPTLLETMEQAVRDKIKHVVVAPIGFLSEHVETLYDLDIEAHEQAQKMKLGWSRVATLRTHEGLISALASAVEVAIGTLSQKTSQI